MVPSVQVEVAEHVDAAAVVVAATVVVSVVQAEVTWLQVQEPQRVLVTPQLTLQRSVQDRPEHRVAQSDWALKNKQHSPL